jgi:hypothetical protein
VQLARNAAICQFFAIQAFNDPRVAAFHFPLKSAHPEMTNLPDIGVARKILSSEYQPYAPQGHFLRGASG